MITVIEGAAGSGKTWLMTRMLHKAWRAGSRVAVNYNVNFSEKNEDIIRWYALEETYPLKDCVIGLDEGQKLFEARRWQMLPLGFIEKISQQRHQGLDLITTTQDFLHIDFKVRSNLHERYACDSLFRFPRDDRKEPIIQFIRVKKYIRRSSIIERKINWVRAGLRFYFISRYWTEKIYNTYTEVGMEKFIWKVSAEKRKLKMKVCHRELVNSGRKRM